MSKADRHLLTLFVLLAVTGAAIALPREATQLSRAAYLDQLPLELGGWRATAGGSDEILPPDPRTIDSLHRTYSDGTVTVWLAISRYPGRNDPRQRPSVNRVVLERGASSVTRDLLTVTPNGDPTRAIRVNRVMLERPGRSISVFYWYQLGRTAIVSDYRLRLRLFWDSLLERHEPLVLVRVAIEAPRTPEQFLQAMYPHLANILSL